MHAKVPSGPNVSAYYLGSQSHIWGGFSRHTILKLPAEADDAVSTSRTQPPFRPRLGDTYVSHPPNPSTDTCNPELPTSCQNPVCQRLLGYIHHT